MLYLIITINQGENMGIIILIGAGAIAFFMLCITSDKKTRKMITKEEKEYCIN